MAKVSKIQSTNLIKFDFMRLVKLYRKYWQNEAFITNAKLVQQNSAKSLMSNLANSGYIKAENVD